MPNIFQLFWKDSHVVLVVRDDGRGLPEGGGRRRSLGILGMGERARALDGDVKVSGSPGQGTTVTARIPITSAK